MVEEHHDRIGGQTYRVLACPACGVVSSEPRVPVDADWYVREAPLRESTSRDPLHGSAPGADWRFQQFFADRLPPGRLLDVGCGDGGFMKLAAARGFSPTGFDYDQRVVQQARTCELDAHCAEFEEFVAGRQEHEFEALTLFDVLEHTPEPAWFLKKLRRLLRPGGHIAVTLPNALRPLPFGREKHDYPPHHYTRWTPQALRGFLEREGFTVLRQEAQCLKLRYLSDHIFFYRLMPLALTLARRLIFGHARTDADRSISDLYSAAPESCRKRGFLSDKRTRQRLADAARLGFQLLSTPLTMGMRTYYLRRQPMAGDCLYTLAQLR